MTTSMIPVSAQWALEGKQPDGEGYRVLACSTGELDRGNFEDALSRFQLGELSTLPQVSVSYARLGTRPGLSYLALAVHWYATDGESHADGVMPRDDQGRLTAYTSYFCLPYNRLAKAAVGYQAMYAALSGVTLPVADGPPRQVQIAVPVSRMPTADDLAMRVAPLLLTGRPVCVLGAEGTSMTERLAFIDSVMELLPYGFRARMTAATWTRATNRQHRFRLFFSSARRADEPDHVVVWGKDLELTSAGDKAAEYWDFLQDTVGPLVGLSDLTTERGFGPKDILQAVESVLAIRHRLRLSPGPAPGANDWPTLPSPPAPAQADAVEQALIDCAEDAKLANPSRLRSDIAFLAKCAADEITEDRRARYEAVVAGLGLLRYGSVEGKYSERLYGPLLRVAFDAPLTYPAYCRVEQCAGIAPGDIPHDELLAAIVKAGTADQLAGAIVRWHQWKADEKKLTKWLVSGQVDPVYLIRQLSYPWGRRAHARIVCDVTIECLRRAPGIYQPGDVRRELCRHGFLARALHVRHPDQYQFQVYALHELLRAAFPEPAGTQGRDLTKAAIVQILNQRGAPPPTPALLSAVLMLLHKPGAWQVAWDAYIRGSLTLAELDRSTLAMLRDRLPHIDLDAP